MPIQVVNLPVINQWSLLHRRPWALDFRPGDDWVWLRWFNTHIPCGDCQKHWAKILERLPPVFTGREEYFAWGVEAHNEVNRMLWKPVFTVEEARRIWFDTPSMK